MSHSEQGWAPSLLPTGRCAPLGLAHHARHGPNLAWDSWLADGRRTWCFDCSSLNIDLSWRFLFMWFIGAAQEMRSEDRAGKCWMRMWSPLKSSFRQTPWSSGTRVTVQGQPFLAAFLNCVPLKFTCGSPNPVKWCLKLESLGDN